MDEKSVKIERERLHELLKKAEVSERKRDSLAAVIDNMAWMRLKLDEIREALENAETIVTWRNGGEQSGTRVNPLFKAYIDLMRQYINAVKVYAACLPEEEETEMVTSAGNMLDKVKAMKAVRS